MYKRQSFHLSLTVLCAIGHWIVFSLGGWSLLLPTGFLVSCGTLVSACLLYTSPIGERLTGSSTAITVNDAVFDGSSLSFSLDIAHLPGAPEVYLYPRVTAMQAGQIIPTAVTGFQQVSEDESYCLSANLSGFGLYEGIFMPARGIGKAEQGYYSLDAVSYTHLSPASLWRTRCRFPPTPAKGRWPI